MSRYSVRVFLIHNFSTKDVTDSTELGSFDCDDIPSIKINAFTLLKRSGLKFERFIEFVEYYAVLKVSGSDKGCIVDVCIQENQRDTLTQTIIDEFSKETL